MTFAGAKEGPALRVSSVAADVFHGFTAAAQ